MKAPATPSATSSQDDAPATTTRSRLTERTYLWVILGGYLILGAWYSIAVPSFETPDEIYHYAFARHMAQGNWLPVQSNESTGPWEQEGSQAPLYYMLSGWLTAGVDQSDFESESVFNPRANMGNPLYPGNKNRMLYSAAPKPLRGTNLALHVGRWLSLLMGAATVWLIYRTAKLAFPAGSTLPLMAALLVAVLPQYIFISASFSNDNMVVVASAAVLFWLARILTESSKRPVRLLEWIILGAMIGIAALSKLQALGLVALAGGVGLAVAWKGRSWRTLIVAALGVAIPSLLIAGWWYWRNYALYADWTGVSHLTAINGLRQKPLDLDDFWLEFRGLRYSFWGLFGWFNILLPSWFYAFMDLVSIVAMIGAAIASLLAWRRWRSALLRNTTAQVRLLLLAWIALSVALLLAWMIQATGSQGRLVFPALGAFSIWFVIGLEYWFRRLPQPARIVGWAITPALLLAMSIYGVTVAIPAAYSAPLPLASVPAGATPVQVTYGDDESITLVAIDSPDQRYHSGDSVPVTLYLYAQDTIERDYELFIQLLDEQGEVLGNITSHPGWGRHPTSLWQSGVVYGDEYAVPVTGVVDPNSPVLARLYVGFIDPDTQPDGNHPVTARDAEGNEITPFLADIPIASNRAPSLSEFEWTSTEIIYDNTLEISGVAIPTTVNAGDDLTATLHWTARATPDADYTAFLHMLDSDGTFIAGQDQAPAGGRFPTSYWQEDDHIISQMAVPIPEDLPPAEYELWVGLYETASQGQTRMPITESGEYLTANDMVSLGTVSVIED